ncbi:phosphoglycerate mutase [Penicillium cataractarum]|uniref:Phosphoglycerate mutase n=1 Tax=Penicillium cataractarum TaxID=2100454 RepID=A0A9W9S6E1_9EURO|nr:phosphoglycerate mutase [Penicillium cataractarum]KAJ5370468.1 phosphoglycerate mutase [Penicillium cataractarum]
MKLCALSPALLGLVASVQATSSWSIEYSTVTGYFLQDETATDASTFDYTAVNFGLINRTYPADQSLKHNGKDFTQWERFYHQVQKLNDESNKDVEYKVLFLGRHGEGWHNAAETYYGTPAWNVSPHFPLIATFAHHLANHDPPPIQCYWAELDGNSTATWHDAALTTNGINQALKAHNFWQKEIDEQRIHTPDNYYVSPLTRTLQTANYTFNGLNLPHGAASFKPLIKELFREGISIHTCDHRRSKTYIKDLFPSWRIESGFAEDDELWNGVTAETSAAQDVRSTTALGEVFFAASSKEDSFVSVTSHSGEISSILRVLGHRTFSLSTGAVIPVLVKAEKVKATASTTTSVSWTVSAHCTAPPVTSVTACVCPSSAVPVTTPLVTDV